MNANTVFRFEFFSSSDLETDETINQKKNHGDEIDSDHNELDVYQSVRRQPSSGQASCLNGHLTSSELLQCQKLNHQIKANFDYQLQRQHSQLNFNRQLNQRLIQHLNSLQQQSGQKFIHRLKTVNGSKLRQSRLFGFLVALLNYHKTSLSKLNLKLIHLLHLLVYYLQFLVTDVFHYYIFCLLPNRCQRKILVKWLTRVTGDDLTRNVSNRSEHRKTSFADQNLAANSRMVNSIDQKASAEPNEEPSLMELFSDGRLLCGLVENLNAGACPRYDLLDPNDVHTNLDLAYRLVLTFYGLDEKLNLVNLGSDEAEQRLLSLISKIRYIEVKRELCALYEIEDRMSHNAPKSSAQENYLIKGMGLFAGIKNKISFFNIFYFTLIDIVVEIVGPASYACRRIKVAGGRPVKNQDVKSPKHDEQEIPLKFVIKKQLIEISYIAQRAGWHRISIVHQGHLILNSPYNVKIDDCD